MNLLVRVAIFLGVTLVLLFLFAQFVRRTSMFFPARYPLGEWNTSSLAVQPSDELFTTDDARKVCDFIVSERQVLKLFQ